MRRILISVGGVFGAALGWLMSFKVLALWFGPEGVGLFAQLRQIIQTATLGATFGGTNLVVQGLAARDNEAERREFRRGAFRLTGMAGVALGLWMLLAAPQIASLTLSTTDPELVWVIRWLALAVMLNVAATYLMAVLNGYRAFGSLAIAQVLGPLVLTLFLVAGWLGGTFRLSFIVTIGFLAGFGVALLVGLLGVARLSKEHRYVGTHQVKSGVWQDRSKLLHFALSSVAAALSSVVTLLIIRAWIIEAEGLAYAGLFEVGWTLTFNYMTLFLTACNISYLPALSASKSPEAQRICILKTTYLVLGGSLIVGCSLIAWPLGLIAFFYSPEFGAAREIIVVLVLAIIVRGVSWVYGSVMLAARSLRAMLVSELMLNAALLSGTKLVLNNHGSLADLGWAFVVPHLFYLAFVVEFVSHANPLMHRRDVWPLVVLGGGPFMLWILLNDTNNASGLPWPAMLAGMLSSMACLVAYRRLAR